MSTESGPAAVTESARRLIELIETENACLEARQPEKLADTEARKRDLIERYRAGVDMIRSGRVRIRPEERQILIDTGRALETAMTRHARKVVRMKSVTEGLVHAVAERAARNKAPADGYGANGRVQAATLARNAYRAPTALSVNRMV